MNDARHGWYAKMMVVTVAWMLVLACLMLVNPAAAQEGAGDPVAQRETITHRVWAPGTPIGQGTDPGGNAQPTTISNGRMTAPQDQTQDPVTPSPVYVLVGKRTDCTVEDATDIDLWTSDLNGDNQIDADPAHSETGTAADDVTYKWTGGNFVVGGSETAPQLAAEVESQRATWLAPQASGNYTLSCVIDDVWKAAETGVMVPETGTRNDEAITRSVTIKAIEVSFRPESLTRGAVRACAGALPSGPHVATAVVHAVCGTENLSSLPLDFSFDTTGIDYTGTQTPQFISTDAEGHQVRSATLTINTDPAGNASITVLSSDLVSSPRLVVKFNGAEADRVGCDFAAAQQKRRYGIKVYDQGYADDKGWDFDPGLLAQPGDTTPGTVFLKFRRDPGITIDTNYFLVPSTDPNRTEAVPTDSLDADHDGDVDDTEFDNGLARGRDPNVPSEQQVPLDDDGNWLAVTDHTIHIAVDQILPAEGVSLSSTDVSDYSLWVDAQGCLIDQDAHQLLNAAGQPVHDPTELDNYQPPAFISIRTSGNGSAGIYLKAGPLIGEVSEIVLTAEDKTTKVVAP